MKIIGNTMGMGLPKPNLMQTDPSKGDYVKGKEEFLKQFGGGTGSNNSSLLVVTFTEENGTLTPSHTYAQIKEWLDNGGSAVLTDGKVWYNLATVSASIIRFERTVIAASGALYVCYVIPMMGDMTETVSQYEHIDEEQIASAVEDYMAEHPVQVPITFDYLTEEVEEEIPCTGITLNKSTLTFNGTGQQTIVATVTPADTTDVLKWTSNNQKLATVSNGIVTVYANGSATITATCGNYSATCTVEVSGISETVSVTGIALNQNTASVQVGETVKLTATVKPDNATNKTVLWTSDNETVATVVDGVVTGVSDGTASIGAMTADGGFSAVCNVTVAAASNYKNLFDKDTMVTANQGINGQGSIGNYNWGLARVPVKENTEYSIKMCVDHTGIGASPEIGHYNGATAGAFGFADETGDTVISRLSFSNSQSVVDAGTNGANALLQDYSHADSAEVADGFVYWVTFTTPAGCAYLLFNTTLKNNADYIQLEEGDTIHDYYLPYVDDSSGDSGDVTVTYANLFDKDTMTTANQGLNSQGSIGTYTWGLARVPVKENTEYSIKMCESGIYAEANHYGGATAGAFGFADETGETIISFLSFGYSQSDIGKNGMNAVMLDYMHGDATSIGATSSGVEWVTFTTPAGCAYLLFNTTLKNNADKIQLEEGDTIHDYYMPYVGGES